MQFDAMKNSSLCCEDDRTKRRECGLYRKPGNSLSLQNVTDLMAATQWSGCGAKPGAGLLPMDTCIGTMKAVRPMVLPGYGAGAHGFDTGILNDVPNVNANYPLIYQLPDSDFNLDPMDAHLWTPPTSRYASRTDPYAQWTYAVGPKV